MFELTKVSKEDYIDPRYKKYMKSKKGRKIIKLLRILTERAFTREELRVRTGFSKSEVRKLLFEATDQNFVAEIGGTKVRKKRGRSVTEPFKEKETTRPPSHYALTSEAMWLMRFDPEVRDRWQDIEKTYDPTVTFTLFDSYANLLYAIQKHPILREYRKPYYFMDQETFEQMPFTSSQLGDALNYLKEGMSLQMSSYKGELVGVELPITIELEVTDTEPGFRGDTATSGTKPAKMETGITIQVPLFINKGDIIKVDTRSGSYLERAG